MVRRDQAVNVEKWTGWSPYYDEDGPVIYNFIPQSYINIRPVAAAATAEGGGADAGVIAGVTIPVAVVAGVLVWWLLRRRAAGRVDEA